MTHRKTANDLGRRKVYSGLDFASFETIQFIPSWVEFSLTNGDKLDIMTSMVGVEASFEKCLQMARQAEIKGVLIPVLDINHVIANKKPLASPKTNLTLSILRKFSDFATKKIKPAAYDSFYIRVSLKTG